MRRSAFLVAAGLATVLAGPALSAAPPAEPTFPSLTLDPATTLAAAHLGRAVLPIAGEVLVFDLVPNPIAHGAVWGTDGVPRGVVSEARSFQGTANGYPAALTVTCVGVFGLVLAPDPLVLYPRWVSEPGAPLGRVSVARWSDAPSVIPDHPEPVFAWRPPEPVTPTTEPANRVVRILAESDWAFYDRWTLGGQYPECWRDVQEAAFNWGELLFERQTGVSWQLTSQWACSEEATCPYQDSGSNTEMDKWLTRFINIWEGAAWEPPHEVGHLMIGTDLPQLSGLAAGIINTPTGYSLSEFFPMQATNNFGTHSPTVLAHEIGHNFNAQHEFAHPIPPLPPPVHQAGAVFTLMWPGSAVRFEFSDGTLVPAKDNVARIVSTALQQLPP